MSTSRLNDGLERCRSVGERLPGVQRVDVSVVGFAPLKNEMIPELTTMEEWWSEKEHAVMAAPRDGAEADRRSAVL